MHLAAVVGGCTVAAYGLVRLAPKHEQMPHEPSKSPQPIGGLFAGRDGICSGAADIVPAQLKAGKVLL